MERANLIAMRSRIGIRPPAQRFSSPYADKSYKIAEGAIPPDHQWWPIQRLRKQYNRYYRRWSLADNVYWLIEQTRFIIEVLGPVLNLNILELVCGDGPISRMLMDRGARFVLGTDISEEMNKQAVAQNRDKKGVLIYDGNRSAFRLVMKIWRNHCSGIWTIRPSLF